MRGSGACDMLRRTSCGVAHPRHFPGNLQQDWFLPRWLDGPCPDLYGSSPTIFFRRARSGELDIYPEQSMKSVLMIAYFFPPEGNAGVYRPLRFVRQLSKIGWSTAVVS